MLSYENQSQASTQPMYSAPVYTIAMLKSSVCFQQAQEPLGEYWWTQVLPPAWHQRALLQTLSLAHAPSTLNQLTTATGKAIKTYGLRTVHLHTGLSLKVPLVIADVVTPLLGLDTILKDSLSLHVGQNSGAFSLVNPVGERTKLEHMGKHLYMIACPSQHGLTNCLLGSLSHAIGFLPADQELQTQKTASWILLQALILMKNPSMQPSEQLVTAWTCSVILSCKKLPMKMVILAEILCLTKKRLQIQGGEPQATSFHPKYIRQPKQPSKQERELHNMTHIPFQPWCVVCQEAKGRASQHKKQKASTKTSKIQLDYAYIRQPQDKEPTTILTWVESLTGLAGSLMTTKTGSRSTTAWRSSDLYQATRLAQSTLQCDGEPALVKLVEEIGKQTSLPTRQSPAYSHQSQAYVEGWCRSLFAQFRALFFDFCHRYKLQPSDVKIGGSLSQHA